MTKSLLILGRQPKLGLAELESIYGAQTLKLAGNEAVVADLPPEEIAFERLGGSVKLARVIETLETTDWRELQEYLTQTAANITSRLPEGKLQLGISAYGLAVRPDQLLASGLSLKKIIKSSGRSVRLVPNKAQALNSAQVIHNHLTGSLGCELILVRSDSHTIICQTVQEQDIEAYAARDQARPKRDARVGMLPPKLAQIIVNLAAGNNPAHAATTVLDPFCGTGVILQEALLTGFSAYGTDLEQRMVEFSEANLGWLSDRRNSINDYHLAQGDATNYQWGNRFDIVAGETYLGRPFTHEPRPEVLREVLQDTNLIHKKFLKNLAHQTKPGFRACLAVPAWKTSRGFARLPVLDSLEELGYTRMSFVHADNDDLIYHREGQFVARELVVLVRK